MKFPNGFVEYMESYYLAVGLRYKNAEVFNILSEIQKREGWKKVCEILREIVLGFEQAYKRDGEYENALCKYMLLKLNSYVQSLTSADSENS